MRRRSRLAAFLSAAVAALVLAVVSTPAHAATRDYWSPTTEFENEYNHGQVNAAIGLRVGQRELRVVEYFECVLHVLTPDGYYVWRKVPCVAAEGNTYKATAPDGTVYSGTFPEASGQPVDRASETAYKCSPGTWTVEVGGRAHVQTIDTWADIDQFHKIDVNSCA
ncbi:hypothetical protein [Streptomyces sp. FH025]|uniref:hypothetical protein n=1 Tax=Streptomyces sp. FH025 TaxID=2815937 RepID=UPI001A9F2569|nr:hypothetical protein [Streptomyces sp. FH025]MBO1414547.1 hypothetical protein [Streptomyces sp. FH025]